MTPKTAVELAIAVERMGGKFYSHLARRFRDQDQALGDLFAELAAEEGEHQRQFSALLSLVSSTGPSNLNEEHQAHLRAQALNEFFGAEGGPFERRDDIHSPFDALSKALELEKATLAYYQALHEVLGDNEALATLIAAEATHVEAVSEALDCVPFGSGNKVPSNHQG